MKDFDLRKYLVENRLLKENLYDELDKFESLEGEFSYQPSSQGILAINNFIEFIQDRNLGRDLDKAFDMYTDDEENEFPPSSDTLVDIENFIDFVNTPEGSDKEDLTSFMNKGIYGTSIDDLKEEDSNKLSGFLKSKVENAVDGLTRKIMFTINSEKSAQEMSEIFKSVTFRMGQLLESYATYTQRVQQSNNSDDSLQKIADAEDDLNISFKKIESDVMGRLKIRP